jgi:choline transport protein
MWLGGVFPNNLLRDLGILYGLGDWQNNRQSVIAWQAVTASSAYLTATSLQGLIINSQPSYVPSRWHGTIIVFAVIIFAVFFTTYLSKLLPHVETSILFLHITLFIIVLTVVTVMSPTKGKSEDVWSLFLNGGGYESKGVSFFVGLITPLFAFSGADCAVHMSEEIRNSSRVVPWAMMGTSMRTSNTIVHSWYMPASILINGLMGFSMLIAILYCLGDIDAALTTPTGYPFIEIFTQASRSVAGGTAYVFRDLAIFKAHNSNTHEAIHATLQG